MRRPDNVDWMRVSVRRGSAAIVVGVMLVLACVTADVLDVAVDVADPAATVAAAASPDEAAAPPVLAGKPQPSGDDYRTRLYRADVQRPKQWGS